MKNLDLKRPGLEKAAAHLNKSSSCVTLNTKLDSTQALVLTLRISKNPLTVLLKKGIWKILRSYDVSTRHFKLQKLNIDNAFVCCMDLSN